VLFLTFKDSNYFLPPYIKIHHNSFPKCFPISLKYYFYILLFYILFFNLYFLFLSLSSHLLLYFPSSRTSLPLCLTLDLPVGTNSPPLVHLRSERRKAGTGPTSSQSVQRIRFSAWLGFCCLTTVGFLLPHDGWVFAASLFLF
jgi:hypothetical protein